MFNKQGRIQTQKTEGGWWYFIDVNKGAYLPKIKNGEKPLF